jgi:RimJ/RimL family protein N-acetyltransferase
VVIYAGDVLLRPYQASDEGCIVRVLMDPEVMRQALAEKALSRSEAESFITKNFGPSTEPCMETVCLRTTGEPIGFAGYRPCPYLGQNDLEFGFVLAKGHWKNGYASALGEKLILHAQHCLDLTRVLAACHPENDGSKAVLSRKLKMKFVDEVPVTLSTGETRRNVYVASFA